MKATEFYEELVNLRDDDWEFEKNGLYAERDRMIRLNPFIPDATEPKGPCQCPITAVAAKHGHYHRVTAWEDAAHDLKINQKFAYNIIRASDQVIGYSPIIRNKLLRALGLDETKSEG